MEKSSASRRASGETAAAGWGASDAAAAAAEDDPIDGPHGIDAVIEDSLPCHVDDEDDVDLRVE